MDIQHVANEAIEKACQENGKKRIPNKANQMSPIVANIVVHCTHSAGTGTLGSAGTVGLWLVGTLSSTYRCRVVAQWHT